MCSVRKVEPERPWNRMMYFPTSDMGAEWTGENGAWQGELWNYSRQIRSCKISSAIFRAVSGLSLTIFPDLPSRLPIKEAGATFPAIPPKTPLFQKPGQTVGKRGIHGNPNGERSPDHCGQGKSPARIPQLPPGNSSFSNNQQPRILTTGAHNARIGYKYGVLLSRTGNRWAPASRGKSGLHRTGWSITSTGREARESATEKKPPTPVGKGEKVG